MENQELETPRRGRPPKDATESQESTNDLDVLKESLKAQQIQIEALKGMLENKPRSLKKPDEHFSHILTWEDQDSGSIFAVVGIKNISERKNENGERRLFADFDLWDGVKTEKKKLDYLNTLTSGHRNKVKVLSSKKEEVEKNQGNSPDPVLHTVQCSDPVTLKKNNQQFSEHQIELIENKVATETVVEFTEGSFIGKQLTIKTKAGEDNCLNY